MENTLGYSDEWQKYKGGYDKFEYDIKLKTGQVVENCYPNAGEFSQLVDERISYKEEQVSEIRFSKVPTTVLNYEVSKNRLVRKSL